MRQRKATMPPPAPVPAPWTERDSVLWETCQILAAIRSGGLDSRPALAHSFVLDLADDDRLLASGPYCLDWWGAVGDGSYGTSTLIAGGGGVLGMGMLATTAIVSSSKNAAARRQAIQGATECWRPADGGWVHLALYGFYLTGGRHGFRRFGWWHIVDADLVAAGVMQFEADLAGGGRGRFLLKSWWAELAFACWCLARNLHHPRFVDGSWLDLGFVGRCASHGYRLPEFRI